MRALITILHFHPLVPIAQALQAAGHEVAFVGEDDYARDMEANGFDFFPAGTSFRELMPQIMAIPEGQRDQWVMENIFGSALPESMAPELLNICKRWQPDIIVRDMTEFGGCIVAEHLGIPHASVEVGVFIGTQWAAHMVGRQLNNLRAKYDLSPDPNMDMLYRYLHLSFVPPSYQDPAMALPPTSHALRTVIFDQSGDEKLPDWVSSLPDQPNVYATLGTAFNMTPGVFPAIIEGLRDEPINLIVTVGRNGDPEQFGPQPNNVHIERYIPQSLILPRCDLVVSHGGWNTAMSALYNGLPMVNIPIGADQPMNAARCAGIGVGRVIELPNLSPQAVRDEVRTVLRDPSYHQKARQVQAEMMSLPDPEHAIELLEELVSNRNDNT